MDIFREIYKHTLKWEGGDKLHNVEVLCNNVTIFYKITKE